MARETEAKIALEAGEIDRIRTRLPRIGGRPGPVDHEENVVFALKSGPQRGSRRRLRLRSFDGRADAVLTCKGPAEKRSAFKSRDEFEVHVTDAASAHEFLQQLGFRPRAIYQKRREHWYLGDVIVALDQLSFGDYLEVEGEESSIEIALVRLGLSGRQHIHSGYARLAKRSSRGEISSDDNPHGSYAPS